MDPDNANAIKTARDIVLASGDRMNRLLETDKKRLDIFRTVSQEYIEDYIFRAQYARISRPQLSGLYQLLKVVLRQVSRPRVNSNEWLDQIDIQLVEAQVTERDFSDLAGYSSAADQPTGEPSNTGAPILSKTITLSELVATWNERLSTMVRESVKSKPATSGSLVNAAPTSNDQYSEVFTALAQIVVADPIITGYAEGKSQDRFSNNCEVRQLVHEKIMLTFIKTMGASPIALEVLGAYTRDEKGFKTQLQDFLLHCIYQEVINNALNVPNML
jgi:hypothetical protein